MARLTYICVVVLCLPVAFSVHLSAVSGTRADARGAGSRRAISLEAGIYTTKHSDKQCYLQRLTSTNYYTFSEAVSACEANALCWGFLEQDCDPTENWYVLCDSSKVSPAADLRNSDSQTCTYEKTEVSTEATTSSPTASPTTSPTASAVGDPHLQNLLGERFDLTLSGQHVLIQIPKETGEYVLLRVVALARNLGGHCADMYFKEVNVTGVWAFDAQAGGFQFRADDADGSYNAEWVRIGTVDMKIAHGRTPHNDRYLNFYVRNLARTGYVVGGLLGEDDHAEEAARPEHCRFLTALWGQSGTPTGTNAVGGSIATTMSA